MTASITMNNYFYRKRILTFHEFLFDYAVLPKHKVFYAMNKNMIQIYALTNTTIYLPQCQN